MSTILAVDLGTTTGWALRTPDGRIVSGTESFKPGRFEGGRMRHLRFRRWLTELKATTDGLQAVHFEEVRRHAAGLNSPELGLASMLQRCPRFEACAPCPAPRANPASVRSPC